jgi:hypothetical protein
LPIGLAIVWPATVELAAPSRNAMDRVGRTPQAHQSTLTKLYQK